MAPIKFEENIKDKLEKRTLSPSPDTWSKLSDRLDEDQKKSKKPMFWYLSIAAGLLLMMAISIQFFNKNNSEEILPQIVNEDIIKEELDKEKIKTQEKEPVKLVNEEVQFKEQEEILPVIKETKNKNLTKGVVKTVKTKTQLAEVNTTNKADNLNTKNEMSPNELQPELDKDMIKTAVADAMKSLKSENISVSDREIDSLLKVASKELFKDKLNQESSTMVDAEQLLESVEDEMGQSFRTKVFEALKGSYETVKTAVAHRNN
ncbi:hypothetical protein [Winogradskyella endarachnes]|uniref:Uncharacterized protein n=1 Tax=Winogradskyella endarachnes TaxID=2681965 RepID=A0A6L6U950_9FLAO|nr:hypothetical protein [Winogradskyella endarachnes]MUU78871.1 hypothetical protein [Winogradskyella endarachnes]